MDEHWSGNAAARICKHHTKEDTCECLPKATVVFLLEEFGMRKCEINARQVGHVYASVAAGLARAATKMCDQRRPELAFD